MEKITYRGRLWALSAVLLLLNILPGRTASDAGAWHFTYLTAEDGMAQNTVDYIYKDSRGFMWLATWNGLNRFDGYDFVRYGTESEPYGLSSLFVRVLTEDRHGCLWVGTEEGVSRLDLRSGRILPPESSALAADHLFSLPVNALLTDNQGRIWVGCAGGLAVVTLDETGDIRTIDWLDDGPGADVLALSQQGNRLWTGYRDGRVQVVTAVSDNAFRLSPMERPVPPATLGEVFAFCPDGDNLWIGTATGLFCYDPVQGRYRTYTHRPADPHSLLQDYVKDLALDADGRLLVATYKGLCIYRHETDDFLSLPHTPGEPGGLNNNFVNSLFVDEAGTVWIGTEKGGVNRMARREMAFHLFRHNDKQPGSLSPNPVNAIYEDSRQTLWIGTVEGGLNRYDPATGGFRHFRHAEGDASSLSHNTVSCIAEGGGYLWVGTWGNGVNRMELSAEGRFTRSSTLVKDGLPASQFIAGLVYDPVWNGLWVATPSGLEFYDIATRSVRQMFAGDGDGLRITMVSGLCLDTRRRLWVATEYGLYCLDLSRSRMPSIDAVHCRLAPEGKTLPRNEKVNCVFEAADHTIWLGCYGNGLYRMAEDTPGVYTFKNYGTESGLSDNVVYGIEEDRRGALWLSTNRGLSCFSPEKEQAVTFYVADGLPNNQFYWAASCRRADGQLLFGNVDGAIFFDPQVMQPDTAHLAVTITGGHLYNEPVDPLATPGEWRLRERDKSFSIEYSALYYASPEKIRYAYRLEGFDHDWIEVDANRRFASYTNLTASRYVFQVRCTNPDGSWSDRITELNIRVIPPFYKENWFISLLMVLVVAAVYSFYGMRIRNLRRQTERLETLVAERTEKIASQKDILAEQARQLDQATQDKINFFTNITHEFRTPLTLILGPIEQALQISVNPKVIDQLTLVRKNSKYLLSLVNQLMDFRKAEAGSLRVNATPGDFPAFVHTLVLPFQALAASREVRVETFIRMEQPYLRFDADLMQKVLTNLLSNAVKFTPDGGCIRFFAALFPAPAVGEGAKFYLSVNDTGAGIPEAMRAQVFDRFYQADNRSMYPVHGQSGTGIGLFLCREIVELCGGRIWVAGHKEKGSCFRILLPVSVDDLTVDAAQVLYDAPELYDPAEETDAETGSAENGKPVLLIVEDNADMRAFIRSVVEDRFTVIEASNGESGLAKTFRHLPDFIISDISMPVMDGLEFCRKVKNNFATSHIPVLLLTARTATDVRIEGYKVGADGYIAKPFEPELLLARINNIFDMRNRMHKAFDNSMDVRTLDMQEESQDKKFLDKLMEVIAENYQDATFDVAELMDKMHMSKSLVHKKLQSLTGQSAVKVIRTYRLTKARELIEHKGLRQMNVSEVAYEVGFNDPKYFTRCFTKHFGVAPSEYGGQE